MYSDAERQIAHEIAQALNDRLYIGLHLKYARTVPHHILREALKNALDFKADKVVKSRARIYTSTIERYLEERHGHSRN